MRRSNKNKASIILTMVLTLLFSLNASGEERGLSGGNRQGYGSYKMMGQDPDVILDYGRDMMRYGFHEAGTPEKFTKYPGYEGYLGIETVNKLNAEQEAFIKATEDLRQAIYEKELYLKAELAKKDPDISIALSFQKTLSEDRGKYEQEMIAHLIRMKKINLKAEIK